MMQARSGEHGNLALTALGALLRVIVFGRHAKHVIALGANAVKARRLRSGSLLFGGLNLFMGRVRVHAEILAQR
jgi:hypothetical protein